MNREVHVRFWESPEVKVLRATRQSRPKLAVPAMSGLPPSATELRTSLMVWFVPRADKPAHLIHLFGAGEQCRGDHKSALTQSR